MESTNYRSAFCQSLFSRAFVFLTLDTRACTKSTRSFSDTDNQHLLACLVDAPLTKTYKTERGPDFSRLLWMHMTPAHKVSAQVQIMQKNPRHALSKDFFDALFRSA